MTGRRGVPVSPFLPLSPSPFPSPCEKKTTKGSFPRHTPLEISRHYLLEGATGYALER